MSEPRLRLEDDTGQIWYYSPSDPVLTIGKKEAGNLITIDGCDLDIVCRIIWKEGFPVFKFDKGIPPLELPDGSTGREFRLEESRHLNFLDSKKLYATLQSKTVPSTPVSPAPPRVNRGTHTPFLSGTGELVSLRDFFPRPPYRIVFLGDIASTGEGFPKFLNSILLTKESVRFMSHLPDKTAGGLTPEHKAALRQFQRGKNETDSKEGGVNPGICRYVLKISRSDAPTRLLKFSRPANPPHMLEVVDLSWEWPPVDRWDPSLTDERNNALKHAEGLWIFGSWGMDAQKKLQFMLAQLDGVQDDRSRQIHVAESTDSPKELAEQWMELVERVVERRFQHSLRKNLSFKAPWMRWIGKSRKGVVEGRHQLEGVSNCSKETKTLWRKFRIRRWLEAMVAIFVIAVGVTLWLPDSPPPPPPDVPKLLTELEASLKSQEWNTTIAQWRSGMKSVKRYPTDKKWFKDDGLDFWERELGKFTTIQISRIPSGPSKDWQNVVGALIEESEPLRGIGKEQNNRLSSYKQDHDTYFLIQNRYRNWEAGREPVSSLLQEVDQYIGTEPSVMKKHVEKLRDLLREPREVSLEITSFQWTKPDSPNPPTKLSDIKITLNADNVVEGGERELSDGEVVEPEKVNLASISFEQDPLEIDLLLNIHLGGWRGLLPKKNNHSKLQVPWHDLRKQQSGVLSKEVLFVDEDGAEIGKSDILLDASLGGSGPDLPDWTPGMR